MYDGKMQIFRSAKSPLLCVICISLNSLISHLSIPRGYPNSLISHLSIPRGYPNSLISHLSIPRGYPNSLISHLSIPRGYPNSLISHLSIFSEVSEALGTRKFSPLFDQ